MFETDLFVYERHFDRSLRIESVITFIPLVSPIRGHDEVSVFVGVGMDEFGIVPINGFVGTRG